MLIYEYHVREKFKEVRGYAERIHTGFKRRRRAEHLLTDVESFSILCTSLERMLVEPVAAHGGSLRRHIGWLKRRLSEGAPELCKGDILDILGQDLPALEQAFDAWCKAQEHYDAALRTAITDLLLQRQFASALREAFVILKDRMVRTFNVESSLDGTTLVNAIFGANSSVPLTLGAPEKQAHRDLFSGMFGMFRNQYMHQAVTPTWRETDAVLSMINHLLGVIDGLAPRPPQRR